MKFLKMCTLVIGLLLSMSTYAELILVQEAIEAHNIKVRMHGNKDGSIQARGCAKCDYINLTIDHNTAITVNGKAVKMGKHLNKNWPGDLVIYDVETGHVVRLDLSAPTRARKRGE